MSADRSPNTRATTTARRPRAARLESRATNAAADGVHLHMARELITRLSPVGDRVPGGTAVLVRRLQAKVGNQAVQRLVHAREQAAIQRAYQPTKAEDRELDDLIPRKWGKDDKALENAKGNVTSWCASHAQFLSLVNNVGWDEFVALRKKYKSGTLVPTKIAAIKAKMQLEMKAELAAIEQQKIEARRQQIETFRTTGQPGAGLTYADAYQQGII
jgi:hypothetical protein